MVSPLLICLIAKLPNGKEVFTVKSPFWSRLNMVAPEEEATINGVEDALATMVRFALGVDVPSPRRLLI